MSLILERTQSLVQEQPTSGLESYCKKKVEELELKILDKRANLRRLEAQRNEMNTLVKNLKEELYLLLQPASQIGEVSKMMGKKKIFWRT
jgi:26S proteasome regulatory subunit T6